jgi:hypothetical protein
MSCNTFIEIQLGYRLTLKAQWLTEQWLAANSGGSKNSSSRD